MRVHQIATTLRRVIFGPQVRSAYDKAVDVLYVQIEGTVIRNSRGLPEDPLTILNYDDCGRVVGVQVMYATDLDPKSESLVKLPWKLRRAVLKWCIAYHVDVRRTG